MGPDILPENSAVPPGTIPRVIALFRPHKMGLAIVSAIVIISGALSILTPLLIRNLIDKALFPASELPNIDLLWKISLELVGLTIVGALLGLWQTYLTAGIGQAVRGYKTTSADYKPLSATPHQRMSATSSS